MDSKISQISANDRKIRSLKQMDMQSRMSQTWTGLLLDPRRRPSTVYAVKNDIRAVIGFKPYLSCTWDLSDVFLLHENHRWNNRG